MTGQYLPEGQRLERQEYEMKTIKKIGLVSAVAFAMLAFSACDDSSSASEGNNETSAVESSSSVKDSDSTEESSSSIDKKSSGNETKDKYSSSSIKESKNSSDSKSSSSVKVSILSSSSVALATPCKTETEDNCEYGTLLDERDGQEYKTVKIGDQWWMAENLNYNNGDSYCYADSAEYCEKYGRLYYYASVRGNKLCPSGWRSPDTSDFQILVSAVGGVKVAGQMLKSTTGWVKRGEDVNGVDAFGFSALPAGKMWLEGTERGWTNWTERSFLYLNEETIFWMNGMSSSKQPIEYYLRTIFYYPSLRLYFSDVAELFRTVDYYAVSVRCIKEIE